MQTFDINSSLVENHFSSSGSLSKIPATVFEVANDAKYAGGPTWPDALLSINPHFEEGKTTTERVAKA